MSGALLLRYQHMTNHPMLSKGFCSEEGFRANMSLFNSTLMCSSCTGMAERCCWRAQGGNRPVNTYGVV